MQPGQPIVDAVTEQDLRLLRIFRTVAEAGGLTAAEMTLRMERSTISRHVQALEGKLGGPVCVRGPGGFELTELGRSALQAAVAAEDMLARIRDDLNRTSPVVTGDLRVGVADNCFSNPQARLVEVLAKVRQQAPAVNLSLTVKPPVDLVADVLAGRCHAAIVGAGHGQERLETTVLFKEHFRLYVAASHKPDMTLETLLDAGMPVVTRDCDPHSLALARRTGQRRRLVAAGLEAVALLVASGGCLGFLPTHMADALPGRFAAVAGADGLAYNAHFAVVRDRGRAVSRPEAAFLTTLNGVFAGN